MFGAEGVVVVVVLVVLAGGVPAAQFALEFFPGGAQVFQAVAGALMFQSVALFSDWKNMRIVSYAMVENCYTVKLPDRTIEGFVNHFLFLVST